MKNLISFHSCREMKILNLLMPLPVPKFSMLLALCLLGFSQTHVFGKVEYPSAHADTVLIYSMDEDGDGVMPDYELGAAPWNLDGHDATIVRVVIKEGVTRIGKNAFKGCSRLTSVIISTSVTSIGNSAFYGCNSLDSIAIPRGVTSIEDNAFYNCSNLASVTIPQSVTSIGNGAFLNCSRLNVVANLNPNPQAVSSSVFRNVPDNVRLYVPSRSVAAYEKANGWGIAEDGKRRFKIDSLPPGVELNKKSLNFYLSNTLPEATDMLTVKFPSGIAVNKYDYDIDGVINGVIWESTSTNEQFIKKMPDGLECKVIANVDDKGEADVIVTTADGNFTDTCHITVNVLPDPKSVESVRLDQSSITLHVNVDATATLTASIDPSNATNQEVRWESNDPNIVTITPDGSTCVVTAVKAGTATIKVISEDNDLIADECTVIVRTPIRVDNVYFDEEFITLSVGETDTLTAVILPLEATHKKVIWEKSNDRIDTTFNSDLECVITAKYIGTTNITVTTADGGKKSICHVTVTPGDIKEVNLDKHSATLCSDSTETLTASINSDTDENKEVQWKSSNTSVATVSYNGLKCDVKAVAPGTADIIVTTESGHITDTCHIKVMNNDATLNSLSVTSASETPTLLALSPTFSADNADYTVEVDLDRVPSVMVIAVPPRGATVTINEAAVTEAKQDLVAGVNPSVTVRVTSEDRLVTKPYTVTVTARSHTNIAPVGASSVSVYRDKRILHVNSPVSEQVTVYSVAGTLLYRSNKPAGKATFAVSSQGQVLIVRGSSGWARKLIFDN